MLNTMEQLVSAAAQSSSVCRLAVAVAQDEAVLKAVFLAKERGLVEPILVGDREAILKIAAEAGLALDPSCILDEPDKPAACMKAAALVRDGKASLIMKGFVDTSYIMKAVLSRENELRTGNQISHVAVFEIPGFDRLVYLADSAMNIAPTLEQKVSIVNNTVSVAHALGNAEPKVAVLCAVEKVNPKMPCTLDAEALTEMNKDGRITGCVVDGPLALDNAVSAEAAHHKGISGPVPGNADVLIVPDIEAGNMLNKSIEYFAHGKKAGVIMGAKVPVVLTSRATSAESKMYSIALGALIAAEKAQARP